MLLLFVTEIIEVHTVLVGLVTIVVVILMFNVDKKLARKSSPTFLREIEEKEKKPAEDGKHDKSKAYCPNGCQGACGCPVLDSWDIIAIPNYIEIQRNSESRFGVSKPSGLQASQRVIDYLLGKTSRQNHRHGLSSYDTLGTAANDDALLKREREKKQRKYALVQDATDSDKEKMKAKITDKIEELPNDGDAKDRSKTL